MSETVQLALIQAAVSITATVAGATAAYLTWRGNKKVDAVAKTADKIEVATNGTLHTLNAALEVANTKSEGLREVITAHTDARDAAAIAVKKS